MAKARKPIGLILQRAVAMTGAILVAACSHDPVMPAPVYMNGATTVTPAPGP